MCIKLMYNITTFKNVCLSNGEVQQCKTTIAFVPI